jgi:predicted dehydrogenase
VTELAADVRAVTQMGTQIHALPTYRRVVELVRSGAIGPVREVVVFCNGKTWSGGERPADAPPVPESLHYDLWLGPAAERPYHPEYVSGGAWRRWWAFGGGTLADMSCHYTDLAFWALGLDWPESVEAEGPQVHPETTPPWLVVRYEFPARTAVASTDTWSIVRPAVKLSWYDGDRRPEHLEPRGLAEWQNGVLFIGDGGFVVSDYYNHLVGPKEKFAGFEAPKPWIPDSVGHYEEWISACKTGGGTTCPFHYSGRLTETVLLGNVAYRTGRRLEWDARRLRATNAPEAAEFVESTYRRGWSI